MPTASLLPLVARLDSCLNTAGVPDHAGARNGLQVENRGQVALILAAVDAGLRTLEKAAAVAAGRPALLLVHHGIFWHGVQPVCGVHARKLRLLLENDLALYSSHLPLDLHPQLGNNALLARALGRPRTTPFLGAGVRTVCRLDRERLLADVARVVNRPPVMCAAGPAVVRQLGIVTGAGGSMVAEAAAAGVDTLLTGEGPQWSWVAATELGINVIYAGHYATETFGVKALAARVARWTRLPWEFLDEAVPL